MNRQIIENLPKEKIGKQSASTEQIKYLSVLIKHINKSIKKGYPIESFMVATHTIESILLPMLINLICRNLAEEDLPSFFGSPTFYHLNLIYLALSQDTNLYKELEEFRNKRNKIVHRLSEFQDIKSAQKEAKLAIRKYKILARHIIERLSGKMRVPVLTYYSKGWNDCRKEILAMLDRELS